MGTGHSKHKSSFRKEKLQYNYGISWKEICISCAVTEIEQNLRLMTEFITAVNPFADGLAMYFYARK